MPRMTEENETIEGREKNRGKEGMGSPEEGREKTFVCSLVR